LPELNNRVIEFYVDISKDYDLEVYLKTPIEHPNADIYGICVEDKYGNDILHKSNHASLVFILAQLLLKPNFQGAITSNFYLAQFYNKLPHIESESEPEPEPEPEPECGIAIPHQGQSPNLLLYIVISVLLYVVIHIYMVY
jgi:hypothetical protein